ncbi:MAG: peptidylprolyl isomerase, partial [Acidobacteria bacterium]|nr:peptidylprolyl isomerase [Acidobacteriota bacterium]
MLVSPAIAGQEKTAPKTTKAGASKAPAQAAPATEARAPGLYMTFETDLGNITCKLYEKEAPITVGKIVGLATGKIGGKKFYDGLTFHRVIPQFMIQGGDPKGNGSGEPEYPGFPFDDEIVPSLKFDDSGKLAMANSGIRNGHGTNGS